MDGDDADSSGKPEEVMDAEDSDLSQEVSSRTILHWNYRGLTVLPTELLSSTIKKSTMINHVSPEMCFRMR